MKEATKILIVILLWVVTCSFAVELDWFHYIGMITFASTSITIAGFINPKKLIEEHRGRK